jgi:uncharacterized membrane protein (DUF2068 family)
VEAQPFGLRVIASYKLIKAVAEIGLGVVLISLGTAGVADDLQRVLHRVAHHATEAWSIALCARLLRVLTARRVLILAWASICDGVLSAFEGWALRRGHAWSRWFIVGATSFALPFEIVALVRHTHLGRFALLLVNVAIVLYLVRERLRVRRAPLRAG